MPDPATVRTFSPFIWWEMFQSNPFNREMGLPASRVYSVTATTIEFHSMISISVYFRKFSLYSRAWLRTEQVLGRQKCTKSTMKYLNLPKSTLKCPQSTQKYLKVETLFGKIPFENVFVCEYTSYKGPLFLES